jgi:hypothetical protein
MKNGNSKGGDYSENHRKHRNGDSGLDQSKVHHFNSKNKVFNTSQSLFHHSAAPDLNQAQNYIVGLNLMVAYLCMSKR